MVNERGSVLPDWTRPPESIGVVPGCIAAPGDTDATPPPRQGQTVRWTVYVPPDGAPIVAIDRIGLPGIETLFALEGEPVRWPTPDGGDPCRVLRLVDQEG
jgi:hypothetical protein